MGKKRYGDEGDYLRARCYACGHRLRSDLMSNGCPQCGQMFDGRPDPKPWPEDCECQQCEEARANG